MARNFGVVPYSHVAEVTIPEGEALSNAFDARRYIGEQIYIGGTWTAANISFKLSDSENGTYDISLDDTGVPIQISNVNTGRAGWYAVPTKAFAGHWVKIFSKSTTAATEDAVNQAAARAMKVMLK